MGNPRIILAMTAVLSVLLLSALSPVAVGGSSGSDHPDLSVISLKVIPRINHYAIAVVIRNIGASSTSSVDGSIFDEYDLRAGEETLITNFQIPSLDPDEEFIEEFSWTRDTTGHHRIWVSADVDGEIDEINKENNVAFTLIQLPDIRDISAGIDGIPSSDMSGHYLSGISLPVNFSIDYSGLATPDLLRVYTNIDDGPSRYAPTGSDGISHITYDVGDLDPGSHIIQVNASSSGFPIEKDHMSLSVMDTPFWFSNLSHTTSSFNSSLSAYVLGGYIDIPEISFVPDIDGIDDMDPLQIFNDDRDLHLTAYILLDGTTTIEFQGDVRIETPSSTRSYKLSGTGYYPSAYENIVLDVIGSGDVEIDLGSMMRPGVIDYEIMDNLTAPLIFSPILFGSSDCSLALELTDSGGIGIGGGLDIVGAGVDESTISSGLYGLDNPIIFSDLEVEWSTSHDLSSGNVEWISKGDVSSRIGGGIVDVGISGYGPIESESISDMGYDLEEDLDGSIGSVYIPIEPGSISSIYHLMGEDVELVHQSNLYKSNPELVYLHNDTTIVIWSEATTYSTDMMDRASSMRLFLSSTNSSGGFTGPAPLFHSVSTDSRPVLVRDEDGMMAALIWQRDLDGNVSTRDDVRIMFSTYVSAIWSDPVVISSQVGSNRLPTAFHSISGDIWTAWSIGDRIAYRVYIVEDGGWSDIKYLGHMEDGGILYNPSMSAGSAGTPELLFVRSGRSWEKDFVLVSRKGDLARESLWSDEDIIARSDYWMEGPSGYLDLDDILHVTWRGRDGGDGEIFTSRRIPGGASSQWLPKLKITDDTSIQITPSLIPLDRGSYFMGWYSMAYPSDNITGLDPGVFDIGVKNLSRAAEVVSVSVSTHDYSIGDFVVVNAGVRNVGMSREMETTIILRRLIRDPITSETVVHDLAFKKVSFHSLLEETSIDFSVTIAEYQLGLYVVTEGPQWGSPAYSSIRYISLPVVQDPIVRSISMRGTMDDGKEAAFTIRIDNHGKVPTGDRFVHLMSTAPTLPAVFPGNLFEPVEMHSTDPGVVINKTMVNVGPGSSSSVTMNLTIVPGQYVIWVEIEAFPWENEARRSADSIDISCMPSYGIGVDRNLFLIDDISNFSAEVELVNNGGCKMADLPVPGGDLPDGMIYPAKEILISQNFTSNTWTYTDSIRIDAMDIGPGEVKSIPLGYNGSDPIRGFIDHSVELKGFQLDTDDIRLSEGRIIAQEQGGVELGSDPVVCDKAGVGHCITLDIQPLDHRNFRAVFITVYNGFVHDDVIKSQGMATGTGSTVTRSIDVPLNLDEGYYTITIVLSTYPGDADSFTTSDTYPLYSGVYHIVIVDSVVPEGEGDDGYDWDEIQRAALIAAALSMVVIGAAVILKFADKSGEGEN